MKKTIIIVIAAAVIILIAGFLLFSKEEESHGEVSIFIPKNHYEFGELPIKYVIYNNTGRDIFANRGCQYDSLYVCRVEGEDCIALNKKSSGECFGVSLISIKAGKSVAEEWNPDYVTLGGQIGPGKYRFTFDYNVADPAGGSRYAVLEKGHVESDTFEIDKQK